VKSDSYIWERKVINEKNSSFFQVTNNRYLILGTGIDQILFANPSK